MVCVCVQVESGKAAKMVAKVLQQCHEELGLNNEAVRDLWVQSRLSWNSLGVHDEDLAEFLANQVRFAL